MQQKNPTLAEVVSHGLLYMLIAIAVWPALKPIIERQGAPIAADQQLHNEKEGLPPEEPREEAPLWKLVLAATILIVLYFSTVYYDLKRRRNWRY